MMRRCSPITLVLLLLVVGQCAGVLQDLNATNFSTKFITSFGPFIHDRRYDGNGQTAAT